MLFFFPLPLGHDLPVSQDGASTLGIWYPVMTKPAALPPVYVMLFPVPVAWS